MSNIYHQNFIKTTLNPSSTRKEIFSAIDLYFNKHLDLYIEKSLLNKIIKSKRTFIFKYMLENCYDYNVDIDLSNINIPYYTFMRFTTRHFLNHKSNLNYYINISKENALIKDDLLYIENLKTADFDDKFSINMKLIKIFSELDHINLTQNDFDHFMISFDLKSSLDFFIIFLMHKYNINNFMFNNFIEFFIHYLHKNNLFSYLIKKHDEFTFSFEPLLGHPIFIEFLSKHIHKNNIKELSPVYERHIKQYFRKHNKYLESFSNLLISYLNLKYHSDLYCYIHDLMYNFKHSQVDTSLFLNLVSKSNIKSLFHPKGSFFQNISTDKNSIIFELFKTLINNPETLIILKNNIHSIHPELKSYIIVLDF